MKHILCYVMIFSLLVTVGGCAVEINQSQTTNVENGQEQGQKPDNKQGQSETNKPELPEAEPQDGGINETETQNIILQEIGTQGAGEGETTVVVPPQEVGGEEAEAEECLLEINELRAEFSIPTKRAEYIEFKAKAAGNLNGFQLYIMYETNNPFVYTFPAVDVASGEYITLHLRTLESNCVDELGENLSLSGGIDSCATARDLWVSGSNKLLLQTGIVYLQDANGRIIDAIIMNEAPSNTWNKNQAHFAEIMDTLYNCGMWKSSAGEKPTPFDAVNTSAIGANVYKSVSRYEGQENSHSAKDWYITANFGITPGQANL